MITTYQIRNVLRIYGNQLKKRTMLFEDSAVSSKQSPDIIDISDEARQRQMLNQISFNIVSKIAQGD